MYGEVIIGVNMLFNFAVLSFANKVGNIGTSKRRLLLASLVGATPVTFFPGSNLVMLVSFVGMTVCAFGIRFTTWKKSVVLVLVGALFAGGMLTFFQSQVHTLSGWGMIAIYAIAMYIALYLLKNKWLDVRTVQRMSDLSANSILRIWGAAIKIDVFVDTGNGCTEPLSGNPVHFVSWNIMESKIPEDLKEPLLTWNPSDSPNLSDFPVRFKSGMRLIRLQTVQGQSWVVGFKFDQWIVGEGKKLQPGYIVLTKSDRRYPDGAGAILHVSAMETLNEERGNVSVA
ncbi:sigma-E processing peptidase SpoIIGA [Sporosarcina sp. CAU 1771]